MPSRSCPQRFGRSMRPLFVGHPAHAQGGGASRGHPCLAGRGLAWKGARHQWVGGAVVGGEVAPSRTRRGCVKMGGHFRGALFPAGGGSRWPILPRCSRGLIVPVRSTRVGRAGERDVRGSRCSGVRTQTPAMGHRLLRAGRLPVPPSIVVVHRRMTVRVDSAGILHVLGGQPFTWGPSSEWRRPDLNRRSLGYEPSGLPSFPTPRGHVHPREVHMLAGDVLPVWGVVICRSLP